MFKVKKKETKTTHWRRSNVVIFNFEYIVLHIVLMFFSDVLIVNLKHILYLVLMFLFLNADQDLMEVYS